MQALIAFVAANPWIWAVLIVGLAVWVAALWVIFKAPSFAANGCGCC
jgi:hypothetical protein